MLTCFWVYVFGGEPEIDEVDITKEDLVVGQLWVEHDVVRLDIIVNVSDLVEGLEGIDTVISYVKNIFNRQKLKLLF